MFQGFTFALKPGMTVENVKITVRTRLRLQGRVVYADGTPLANAKVEFQMLLFDERDNRRFHGYGRRFYRCRWRLYNIS